MSLPWVRDFFARGRKVGITGPSGAGKTTFATILSGLSGFPVHEEGAREWLIAHRVDAYWRMPPELVVQMQTSLLDALATSTARIFDRFSVDTVVFLERAREHVDFEAFIARARSQAESLDVIVFFPYRAELLLADGVRRTESTYQLETGCRILNLLVEWELIYRVYVYQHHLSVLENIRAIIDRAAEQAP